MLPTPRVSPVIVSRFLAAMSKFCVFRPSVESLRLLKVLVVHTWDATVTRAGNSNSDAQLGHISIPFASCPPLAALTHVRSCFTVPDLSVNRQ